MQMIFIVALSAWTLAVWAIGSEATRRVTRARRVPLARDPRPLPRLVCVRPLRGPATHAQSAAALQPRYSGAIEQLFLAAADDLEGQHQAENAVQALVAAGRRASLLVTVPGGRNGKAKQLAQLPEPLLRGALVLSLDADVHAASVDADAMVALLLARPTLGAVWMPFAAAGAPRTLGDRLAAAIFNASAHAMPLLAALSPHNLTGKVLAYRPEAVAAAGGWGPSIALYGDDLSLGQRLQAGAFGVAATPGHVAEMVRPTQRLGDVWQRFVRWARIVWEQQPQLLWAYPTYMAAAPLQLLAWAAAYAAEAAPWHVCAVGALTCALSRLRLARLARAACGQGAGLPLPLAALAADAVIIASVPAAMLARSITWRGVQQSLRRAG